MQRRTFLGNAATLGSSAAIGLPAIGSAAGSVAVPAKRSYSDHGRPDDYTEFRVIKPDRSIQNIEPFNPGMVAIVRVTTADGPTPFLPVSELLFSPSWAQTMKSKFPAVSSIVLVFLSLPERIASQLGKRLKL